MCKLLDRKKKQYARTLNYQNCETLYSFEVLTITKKAIFHVAQFFIMSFLFWLKSLKRLKSFQICVAQLLKKMAKILNLNVTHRQEVCVYWFSVHHGWRPCIVWRLLGVDGWEGVQLYLAIKMSLRCTWWSSYCIPSYILEIWYWAG